MWGLSSASRPELWPGLLLSSTTPLGIPPHSQPVSLSLCAAYRPLKAAAPMTTINRFSFRGENLNKSASSDLCRAMTDVSPESSDAVMISAVVISPALFFFYLSLALWKPTAAATICRHDLFVLKPLLMSTLQLADKSQWLLHLRGNKFQQRGFVEITQTGGARVHESRSCSSSSSSSTYNGSEIINGNVLKGMWSADAHSRTYVAMNNTRHNVADLFSQAEVCLDRRLTQWDLKK